MSISILFGTTLFGKDGFEIETEYQERCETWEQAEEMHKVGVLEAKRLQGL